MKWISALNETMDGKTLTIYPPMIVNKHLIKFASGDKEMSHFKVYTQGSLIIHTTDTYIQDTLIDSIKMFKKDLELSIAWMRDEACAPPKNPEIYDDKCVQALYELREKYGEEFPEVFI